MGIRFSLKFLEVLAIVFWVALAFGQSRNLDDSGAVIWDYGTAGKIKGQIVVTKSITIFSPLAADTNKIQIYWPAATTIQRIACSTDTGTLSINFDARAEATPNTAGTDTLASPLACDTNSEVTTTFQSATVAANVPYNLQISGAGTPGVLRIHVTGKY